ncbi:MAG: aminotransferase class V-fold PLP-dependent enzyme [Gemmatimonadota bacterium]
MDLAAWRSLFPVTREWIYLNHAAVSPVSSRVVEAMAAILRDVATNGIVHIDEWNALYASARRRVARLIGAGHSDISFQKNTTDGLLAIANGLDWHAGDAVLVPEGEFPANVYPWLNLARRGVSVLRVPLRDRLLRIDEVAARMGSGVRILAVSSAGFFTGVRADLDGLGKLCRERGALLVVDGIQSVGCLEIDVGATGIDCLAADGHKWLMGPEGCAFLYTSPRARERLQVANLGWASVASAHDFLSCDTALQPDARRFETGTQNTAGIAGLQAAVDLLLEVGMGRVEARVLALTDRLCAGLAEAGHQVLSPRQPGAKSGIVTFTTPGRPAVEVEKVLRAAGVVATQRGGTVRLSPHFYNTEEEVDAALAALRP